MSSNAEAPLWNHDERIKAAVIAAPAASYLFGPGDLREVSVPIQLWRVENDSHAPDAWNGAVIRDNLKVISILTSFKAPITLCFWRPAARPWDRRSPQICHDPVGFDRAAFHREFNQSLVDFFTTKLRDR